MDHAAGALRGGVDALVAADGALDELHLVADRRQVLAAAASAGPPRPGLSGRLRRRRRHGAASYATFCILFAKSRPEVGGGSALPSLL